MKNRTYLHELDDLRGMAIIGVVVLHGIIPLLHLRSQTFTYNCGLLLNQLTRYCVPLFLIIAGLLQTHNRSLSRLGFARFIRRRALRMGFPYLVWTAFSLFQTGSRSLSTVWRCSAKDTTATYILYP